MFGYRYDQPSCGFYYSRPDKQRVRSNPAAKVSIPQHLWPAELTLTTTGAYLSVCVLLDVGTDPAPTSIYHLWKTFDLKPNCGGACGEIVALKGKYWKNLLNPLVAAQNCMHEDTDPRAHSPDLVLIDSRVQIE
jgi:hypothetical protein